MKAEIDLERSEWQYLLDTLYDRAQRPKLSEEHKRLMLDVREQILVKALGLPPAAERAAKRVEDRR